jgi:hypothetical protein
MFRMIATTLYRQKMGNHQSGRQAPDNDPFSAAIRASQKMACGQI